MSIATDIKYVGSKLSEIEQRMSKIDHLNVSMVYRGNVSITDMFDKRTDPTICIDNNPYPYVAVKGDVVTHNDSIYLYDGECWIETKNAVTTDSETTKCTVLNDTWATIENPWATANVVRSIRYEDLLTDTIDDKINNALSNMRSKLSAMACTGCGGNIDPQTLSCKCCGRQYRLVASDEKS